MLKLISSGLLLLVSLTSALKLSSHSQWGEQCGGNSTQSLIPSGDGCINHNDECEWNEDRWAGCADYSANPSWCDDDQYAYQSEYENWGNKHCCVCSDMYWQPVGNGPWNETVSTNGTSGNETVSTNGTSGNNTWDDVWSYQMELSYDNRTWCNLTIANFTQDSSTPQYDYSDPSCYDDEACYNAYMMSMTTTDYTDYGSGWGSDIDFNNRTWCNETTNGANWNNGTCADGACNGGTWYNNTCTDGTWVTTNSEDWGPYTTCYPISANITEVLRDPEHAQCGSRINYNDADIMNDWGEGCGDYAANHESWCGEQGDVMGDGGWGKRECCRCDDYWTPTEPSHYGYYDLPADQQNWSEPNSTFGNNTSGNDTSSNNSTNGTDYIQTPYVPYFEGGPFYEVGYDNRTWCNLTAANFTDNPDGTGWGLDIMWDERPWCANGGECNGASCGPNPNDMMMGGNSDYGEFPEGYMDSSMTSYPSDNSYMMMGGNSDYGEFPEGYMDSSYSPMASNLVTVSNGHTFSGMCNNSSWPHDTYNVGCDEYHNAPSWCSGSYDQGSFYDIECCACDNFYGRN